MALGAKGYFGIARETQFGVFKQPSLFLPIISESLSESIETVFSEALQRTLVPIHLAQGSRDVSGDVNLDLYPNIIGWFLTLALGEPTSSEVATGVYQHEFRMSLEDWEGGAPLPSISAEIHKDLSEAFRFCGVLCTQLGIGIGVGQKIGLVSLSLVGHQLDLQAPSVASPTVTEEKPFLWDQFSFSLDGSPLETLSDFSFLISNSLEAIHVFGYQEAKRFFRSDISEIRISATVIVEDLSLFKSLRDGDSFDLIFRATGEEIQPGFNRYLEVRVPIFRLTSHPINISGPGYLTSSIEGVGLWSRDEGSAVIITLQNDQKDYTIYSS